MVKKASGPSRVPMVTGHASSCTHIHSSFSLPFLQSLWFMWYLCEVLRVVY